MELAAVGDEAKPSGGKRPYGEDLQHPQSSEDGVMGINVGEIIPVIIFGGGAVVLGLSYVAVYLMGKNAARKELGRHVLGVGEQSDRLDRVEAAVESISLGVERLGEGQRYLLGSLGTERPVKPVVKPDRRHSTPV